MVYLRRISFAAIVAALTLLACAPARADVIDGDWCSADGRHISIHGPQIVTPQGTKTTGNYSRHFFSYTIPPNDPSAGTEVYMALVNEFTVHLRTGKDPSSATEIWKRCDQIS